MRQIEIEEVIDHLSYEMKRALEFALSEVAPERKFDGTELFRAFKRGVRRKCNTWEQVPDHLVR